MSDFRYPNAQRSGSQSYRVFLHGRQLGDVMSDVEVATLEKTITENIDAGLADPNGELTIEALGRNGWYVARTRSWDPRIFDRTGDA